jgi:hypothetical protein
MTIFSKTSDKYLCNFRNINICMYNTHNDNLLFARNQGLFFLEKLADI